MERDPYTGAVTFSDLPPSLHRDPALTEDRVRELIREEIEAALAFFEEQTRGPAFEERVEQAIRRRAATGSARWHRTPGSL